jgi:hypothetical protein
MAAEQNNDAERDQYKFPMHLRVVMERASVVLRNSADSRRRELDEDQQGVIREVLDELERACAESGLCARRSAAIGEGGLPQAAQGVKTWQERAAEDGHSQPLSVYCRAEIADLRAQLAQKSEDVPVELQVALDAHFPIPDNPHASVIQRAMDARHAMGIGWMAAMSAQLARQSQPVARVEKIISISGLAEVYVFLESALKVGTIFYAAPPLSSEQQKKGAD